MPGLNARKYKQGSIIYFEGDKNKEIYILKSGRVVLTSVSIETGEEKNEDVKAGEFFGVKSSLGNYPREETAQTLTDSVVLVIGAADFEKIMGNNIRLVMKILRVFSNQLRSLGKNVRQILGDTDLKKPSTELIKLAEYYYKNNQLDYAQYAYKKFLELFPNDRFVRRGKEMLQCLSSNQPYPGKYPELDEDEIQDNSFLTPDNSVQVSPEGAPLEAKGTDPGEKSSQAYTDSSDVTEPDLGEQESEGEFALESSKIDF